MSWTLLLLLFCVHLRCSATSAPDTDSASLLLLIFLFCFVATLCVNQRGGVNKDVYNIHKTVPGTRFWNRFWNFRNRFLLRQITSYNTVTGYLLLVYPTKVQGRGVILAGRKLMVTFIHDVRIKGWFTFNYWRKPRHWSGVCQAADAAAAATETHLRNVSQS